MSEPFISEIRIFGCNYAPRDWAFCDGASLPISENTALFSLIGINFGGNGHTTVGLPDLMARAPIGAGVGPGIQYSWDLGEMGGYTQVVLSSNNLPTHSHTMYADNDAAEQAIPDTNSLLAINYRDGGPPPARKRPQYAPASPDTDVEANPAAIGVTGGSASHNNMQPYNVFNFCIALSGIYPSRS